MCWACDREHLRALMKYVWSKPALSYIAKYLKRILSSSSVRYVNCEYNPRIEDELPPNDGGAKE